MKLMQVISCVGILCILVYRGHFSGVDQVNVGAIYSLDTHNGKVSQIAMKAAVEEINSDPSILGGHTLSLHIHDSNYSGFLSIMGALRFMETDSVAIIGPQSSTMAHMLSHLANRLHLPLLSFTALDPTLSPVQYPYFFQTAPSDLFQMTAIADIISVYHWTQVVAIFTSDEQSRNGITVLVDKLRGRRCRISYKVIIPVEVGANLDAVMQKLAKVKLMETRVLVVHTITTIGPTILKAAEQLGMIKEGYVWIANSWLTTILDSQTNPEIVKLAQGVITLRHHTPESNRKKAFIARWKQLSNGSTGLSVYGLYAYDTVWMVAHAIRGFLQEGNKISFSSDPVLTAIGGGTMNLSALSIFNGGTKMCQHIKETNFTGLTGRVQFNSDRTLVNPSYDIINVVGNISRVIGYWSNDSGLSVMAPEVIPHSTLQNRSRASQKLNNVGWPGGTEQQPSGWAFPSDGRKLRVGVPRTTSFKDFVYQDNRTKQVHGYCIDVFIAATKLLPYAVPYEFILFGDGHQSPNYTEFVNGISVGEFDAAVGDIAIVTERMKIADFTQPFAESGLVVVVPVKKMSSSAWVFLRPFTLYMWVATAAFFLIVGVVIWILEHRVNNEFHGPRRKQFTTVLWFSFSTLFFTHRENVESSLGRIVLVIWLFVVMIIQQSYTASLTSYLTVQQLSSPIKGIDTLITSTAPVGFQEGSYAEKYLNEELHIPKSRLKGLKTPQDYADALEKGQVAAVIDERPYVDMFLSEHCQFAIVGEQFTKSGWGFAFKKDSPIALDMSTALLELSKNRDLQNISDSWLRNRKACHPQITENNSDQLQLINFMGLFIVCAITCIIAITIYFCKSMYKFHQHLQQDVEPSSRKEDLHPRRKFKRRCLSTFCNGN